MSAGRREEPLSLRPFLEFMTAGIADSSDEGERIDAYVSTLSSSDVFALTAAIDALLRANATDEYVITQLRANGLSIEPWSGRESVRTWLARVRHGLAQ